MSQRAVRPAVLLFTFLGLLILFLPVFLLILHEKKVLNSEKEEPPLFRSIFVEHNKNPFIISLPSYLEPMHFSPIWARVNGYLSGFLVDIGDQVKEGQLLAIIETPDLDQEVIQAQGMLTAAFAQLEIARITAERWTSLYQANPEAISAEEVDQMVASYEVASAEVEAARGHLGYLQAMQNFKYIYAPFDGIITERDIDIGYLITLGSNNRPNGYPEIFPQKKELFQIAKIDRLRAFIDVPQTYFTLIQNDLDAEIRIPQLPGKIFKGKINRNAGSLDPLARTLLTQVNIDNHTMELKPGLYAEVSFIVFPETKSYTIPIGALIIRTGPTFVAVVKDNIVHFQEVTIGRDHGNSLQIIEGLNDGDEILINPTAYVQEGMKVRTQPIFLPPPSMQPTSDVCLSAE